MKSHKEEESHLSRLHFLRGTHYIKQIFNGTLWGDDYCVLYFFLLWHIQRVLTYGLGWIPHVFLGDIPLLLLFIREKWSETVNGGCSGGVVRRLPGQLGLKHAGDRWGWCRTCLRFVCLRREEDKTYTHHSPLSFSEGCSQAIGCPACSACGLSTLQGPEIALGQGVADVFPKTLPTCRRSREC